MDAKPDLFGLIQGSLPASLFDFYVKKQIKMLKSLIMVFM